MRIRTAIAWLLWVGFCSAVCAGLFAGCFNDPHFAWPHLYVPGATPQQKTAYEQNQALRFDPYPDPTLSHVDPGQRPIGYLEPREPYPLRPLPAPIVVTPAPGPVPAAVAPTPGPATVTAPYPAPMPYPPPAAYPSPYPSSPPCPTIAPGSFPMVSPSPYPGAAPTR